MKKAGLTLILCIITQITFSQKGKHVVEYHYKKLKKAEGYYLKNQLHGTWKYWNIEGDLEKIETYSHGRLNGTYLVFNTAVFFNTQNIDIQQYWEANYLYFLRKQNNPTHFDTAVAGNYTNHEKEGEWTFWTAPNTRWKYTYKEDKKNGKATKYYYNQIEIEEEYKNDVKHGTCIEYFSSGGIRTKEIFEYGLRNGLSLTYHYKGPLLKKCIYTQDTLNGEYYDSTAYSGEVIKTHYKMGKLHGNYTSYNRNYNLLNRGNYVNNKKQGPWYTYWNEDVEMNTYVSDTLSGPYYKNFKNPGVEKLTENLLVNFYSISTDTSGFGDLTNLTVMGEHWGKEHATVNIYAQDTVPVAFFSVGRYSIINGPYKLYKKGKLFFNGYFTNDELSQTCTWYHPTGKVQKLIKYELTDTEMNYYSPIYHLQTYANGKTYSLYEKKKNEEKFYWENGNLRAHFYLTQPVNGMLVEKLYNKKGKLYSLKEYLGSGELKKEIIYDKTEEDDLSILNDEYFFIGIPEAVIEKYDEEVFVWIEEEPEFPGGYYQMEKFLNRNFTRYPGKGKIVIEFTVDKWGQVKEVTLVYDGVGNGNGIEMAKTVMLLPYFKPGKQQGKPVPTKIVLTCQLTQDGDPFYDVVVKMDKK